MRIALTTAIAAFGHDIDEPPLLAACERAGIRAEIVAWDDPTVSWGRFDAVLLRSTWDYTQHHGDFLAWCERVARATQLFNPLPTIRWNTDKHYLGNLATRGVPIVPSRFFEPGHAVRLDGFGECVVKPSIGAGSRDTARYGADELDKARAHAEALLAQGRSVLVQPYLSGVDSYGETALIFIAGRYSHAIRKGPLLTAGARASDALFAVEDIQPRIASEAEHAVAQRVLASLPEVPLYARVDLLPSTEGPLLLELELVEPSLFFAASEDAADRLLQALRERIEAAARDPFSPVAGKSSR